MYGMLPGISGGLLARIAPPPFSEYVNRKISPLGVVIGGLNFQPNSFSAQARVAGGLLLARSVWVIHPYNPGVGECFIFDAGFAPGFFDEERLDGGDEDFFAAEALRFVLVAMSSCPFESQTANIAVRRTSLQGSCVASIA
jgi:hypothetical protein